MRLPARLPACAVAGNVAGGACGCSSASRHVARDGGHIRAGTPGRALEFPRDFGSHPQFRLEWWYVTGWLETAAHERLGFQITFFRTRHVAGGQSECVRAAPAADRPLRASAIQPAAGCGTISGSGARAWGWPRRRPATRASGSMTGGSNGATVSTMRTCRAEDFALELRLAPTQPPLLNGEQGFSRKGPAPLAASYYYSLPHLQVSGSCGARRDGTQPSRARPGWIMNGRANISIRSAVGWDWVGINLDDGGALMAFGSAAITGQTYWSGGNPARARTEPCAPLRPTKSNSCRLVAGARRAARWSIP